jgi:hypothetical protein
VAAVLSTTSAEAAMTVIELLDYQQLETLRSRFAFPPIEKDLTTEAKNCEERT